MNIKPEIIEKWLNKGEANSWDEMDRKHMNSIIEYLKSKLTMSEQNKNETI